MSGQDPRLGDAADVGKPPPFDLDSLRDRTLRGMPATKVWIEEASEQPKPGTGEIAVVAGELAFVRKGRQLEMLEPGAPSPRLEEGEKWSPHGEWPNLWWRFRGTLAVSGAGLVLRSISLEPVELEDSSQDTRAFLGVSAALLRAIKTDRIIRLALEAMDERREGISKLEGPWWEAWRALDTNLAGALAEAQTAYAEKRKSGGRQPLTDTRLRAVAYECLRIFQDAAGAPPGVHKKLAEQYVVSTKTIEAWIAEARRRGFLAPGRPGRATFAPGPELRPGQQ